MILSAVVPLLVSAAIMIVGNTLLGTLLAVRMDIDGVPVGRIGLTLACYSLGFVVGTLVCPKVVDGVGHIRAFAAFAAIAAAVALLHALFVEQVLWAVLRMVSGFCVACLLTITESWLNSKAPKALRGLVMSSYQVVFYLSAGSAQFLLTTMDPAGFQLFSLVAIIISLSLVPLTLAHVTSPAAIVTRRLGLRALVRLSPLGVAGCFAAGLITSAFNSMAPVYARAIDPSPDWVATFMMVAVFSGLVLQVPLGRLSDRFDRRRVILGLTVAVVAAAVGLGALGAQSTWILLPLLSLFCGLIYTLYPISFSHANDFMEPDQLVPAAAGLLLAFGAGAMIGPVAGATAMARFGNAGLFFCVAAMGLTLSLFTIYRMSRREARPNEEQGGFLVMAQTTPAVSELDPRHVPGDADQLAFAFDDDRTS